MRHAGGELLAYLPMHDAAELGALRQGWLRRDWLAPQPVQAIRGYFGVEVALYFAWLEFYTRLLALLALASAPVLLARVVLGPDNVLAPFYALALVLACACWHQMWRRTVRRRVRLPSPFPPFPARALRAAPRRGAGGARQREGRGGGSGGLMRLSGARRRRGAAWRVSGGPRSSRTRSASSGPIFAASCTGTP